MTVKKKKLIPSVRFPEFKEEWEFKKLREVTKIERGKFTPRPRNDPKYYGGKIPFVQTSDITNSNGKISKYSQTLNEFGLKVSKLFPKGTILITIAANIGYTAILEIDMACPDSLIGIKCKEKINAEFLNFYLGTQQKRMDYLAPEGTQKNINIDFLNPYKVLLTSLLEQQKIASFLTAIDNRIQQLTHKVELLEQYKKGVMQQIFSQQIRFKNDGGEAFPDWEEKKLGEIGITYNGLTGKTKENFGKGKPYINYKQIFDDSKININKFDFVEIDEGEKQSLAKYGDIFFTTSSETPSEVAFSSVLLDQVKELYLNSFCFGYRPKSFKTLKPEFARFLFRSQKFRRSVFKLAQGSTRYNISKVQFMKTKILLPNEPEQQKIAKFLTDIDEKISFSKQQLDKMQTYKRGLLQQMFV